jgi:hypothetical protein
MPHFKDGGDNAHEIINKIPKDKLIIIDKLVPKVTGSYAAVYQNFEKDIYLALEKALPLLSKYHTLKIISLEYAIYPIEIVKGFLNFCHEYAFNYVVVQDFNNLTIEAGDVFITHMENDLVELIEKILSTDLVVGKDVGVISYNESPLKKIILKGITTISTDFQLMGERAANAVLEKSLLHEAMPFHLYERASL